MMAQSGTYLSILLLFSLLNLIICYNGQMYNERRDRAPYIDSNERGTQQLTESTGPSASRLRKPNANYRNHEQQIEPPHTASQSYNQENKQQNSNGGTTKDALVDESIRSVFSTNFGPGLYLFKNTAPFNTQPNINSFADQMIGDQPDSYSSNMSSSDKEFFKVQRSPNGKLSLVYNEDFVPKRDIQTTFPGSNGASSNNDNFENRYQTHSPPGLHGTNNDKSEPTLQDNTRRRDNVSPYTVDSKDCAEGDAKTGKPFCTHLRNYPEQTHLEEIIKTKFSNLESFFGEDLLLPQNISQRMKNEPIEEFLCRSRTRVIYPEAGINKDSDWLFIINTKKYKQGIRIEECINEGSVCGENTGLKLPNRYTATCKQSYIFRSLVAYANETIIKDQFKMPSCCKCVLTVSDV